jgi:general secretion pathway protein D
LMMETQVSKANSFGVTILGATGAGNLQKFGTGNQGDLTALLTNNITSLSGLFVGGGIGKQIDVPGPGGTTVKVNSVNGLISAIANLSGTNVLATPQILTLDNVEGQFESGEKVPTTETTNTPTGSQTSSKLQTVTLSLKITPQINKATRFIKLKIDQKIEDFSNRPLANNAGGGVGTVIRSLATTVVVRDKDTIAMGGLMRDKETNTVNKVPLLGDIPVLGWLFKNTVKSVEKVNLLFFMTPKILAPYEKGNADNVKDLLNRRQAHLKNSVGDDDPFATTVKGLYDKAKKQGQGPLYDTAETAKYQERNQMPEAVGNDTNSESAAPQIEAPDYRQIIEKATNEKAPASSVQ